MKDFKDSRDRVSVWNYFDNEDGRDKLKHDNKERFRIERTNLITFAYKELDERALKILSDLIYFLHQKNVMANGSPEEKEKEMYKDLEVSARYKALFDAGQNQNPYAGQCQSDLREWEWMILLLAQAAGETFQFSFH